MSIISFFKPVIEPVLLFIGKIHWPTSTMISKADQDKIREMLVDNYFVILTYRKNHLSSFFIGIASLFVSGKWAKWTHALMNLEDTAYNAKDFRIVGVDDTINTTASDRALMEATGTGTHITPFELVFDCHAVALLKPKCMTLEKWTGILDKARLQLGKKYDTLFNLADDNEVSCVELVRTILQAEPNYETDFAAFEAMIKKHGNLDPQMYYDCPDFEIVFEARV